MTGLFAALDPAALNRRPGNAAIGVDGLSVCEGAHFNNYSALAAGSCLAALPVVVVYLFAQRSFIKGIFAGSLVE
jgi:ABC-type glycerol-3-phosphate transport system permease component